MYHVLYKNKSNMNVLISIHSRTPIAHPVLGVS